jgi:uncharacterized protein YeaO (DUF488 family)
VTWVVESVSGRRGIAVIKRRDHKPECAAHNDSGPVEFSSPACLMQEFEMGRGPLGVPGIRIKRIYDEPEQADGFRVLVDRLWPRGIKKETAAIDAWARELAPSSELRKWFRHDPLRWTEFRRRYLQELHEQADALEALRHRSYQQPVTLLYAAKDVNINHAVVLRQVIEDRSAGP